MKANHTVWNSPVLLPCTGMLEMKASIKYKVGKAAAQANYHPKGTKQ